MTKQDAWILNMRASKEIDEAEERLAELSAAFPGTGLWRSLCLRLCAQAAGFTSAPERSSAGL